MGPRSGIDDAGMSRSSILAEDRRRILVGRALIRVQFHLWEHDLTDPEQPLSEYGFWMTPHVDGLRGVACRYEAADGVAVLLMNDAVAASDPDGCGVAIARGDFRITRATPAGSGVVVSVGEMRRGPDEVRLVTRLLSWIGGYEQWLSDTFGDAARERTLRDAGIEGALPAHWWELAAAWRRANPLSAPTGV